jgi:hypothetical protein
MLVGGGGGVLKLHKIRPLPGGQLTSTHYSQLRSDHGGGGEGVALLVHNEIHYVPIGDGWREVLVHNVIHYIPVLLPPMVRSQL